MCPFHRKLVLTARGSVAQRVSSSRCSTVRRTNRCFRWRRRCCGWRRLRRCSWPYSFILNRHRGNLFGGLFCLGLSGSLLRFALARGYERALDILLPNRGEGGEVLMLTIQRYKDHSSHRDGAICRVFSGQVRLCVTRKLPSAFHHPCVRDANPCVMG